MVLGGLVVACELVVASGNMAKVLAPREHGLDEPAVAIKEFEVPSRSMLTLRLPSAGSDDNSLDVEHIGDHHVVCATVGVSIDV